MARVLIARPTSRQAVVLNWGWSLERGPLHLAGAHALVSHGHTDWLIIAKGPLSGRELVGSAVATITAPSAQGPGLAEAQVEGPLAHGLGRLGLDAIIIVGRSDTPIGLDLRGCGDVIAWAMDDAGQVSESDVWESDRALRRSTLDVVVTTGIYGMAEHPAASIVINGGFPTTQGGLGAVLGRLKISHILLAGDGHPPVASPLEKEITARYAASMWQNPLTRSERDYPGFAMWPGAGLAGYAASPGFSGRDIASADAIDAEAMMAFAVDDGGLACPGCPQSCLKSFTVGAGEPIDGGRAHQLGVASAHLFAGITDEKTLVAFNSECHRLGLEHVSASDALAGDVAQDTDIAHQLEAAITAHPRGRKASMRVRGMVIPPFDPRGNQGLGVGYALNPTGPRYDVLEHDIDFIAGQHWMDQDNLEQDFGMPADGLAMGTLDRRRRAGLGKLWVAWSGLDALGLCEFAAPPTRELRLDDICELASEWSGATFDKKDYADLGILRLAFAREINRLMGVLPEEDTLPEHFFSEPVRDGDLAGVTINREEFERACEEVRRQLGWDSANGVRNKKLVKTIASSSAIVWSQLEGVTP